MDDIEIRDSGFEHFFPSDSHVYVIMSSEEHSDDVLAVCKSLDRAKKSAIEFSNENNYIYIVKANLL